MIFKSYVSQMWKFFFFETANTKLFYLQPVSGGFGNWPWYGKNEGGVGDKKYRFALTSINKPMPRCIGFARRRLGRGGRYVLFTDV